MAEEPKKSVGVKRFDAKKMIAEHAEKGTIINLTERLTVEIVEDTKYYKKGDIISPQKIKGQALIDQKIAKKYTKKED